MGDCAQYDALVGKYVLYLQDVELGQSNHMATEPTHGPHHPHRSPRPRRAWGYMLAIGYLFLTEVVVIRSRVCPYGDYDRRELSRLGAFSNFPLCMSLYTESAG